MINKEIIRGGVFYTKGVNKISEIIIKINAMSYNLLKKFAKGGEFRKESKNKDGHYFVSIDKKVFDELKKIDDDLNKAIIFTCLQNKINN